MPYKVIPGGYEDNSRLQDALRANRLARRLVERVLTEQPGRGLLYQMLAELAHSLGDQLDALTAMERIRLKKEAPGTPPDASRTDDDRRTATMPHYTTLAPACQECPHRDDKK